MPSCFLRFPGPYGNGTGDLTRVAPSKNKPKLVLIRQLSPIIYYVKRVQQLETGFALKQKLVPNVTATGKHSRSVWVQRD